MAATQAPHPLILHNSTIQRLNLTEVHTHLKAYLSRASIDPSRRPDSTLSNRGDGPQSTSSGGADTNTNLTLFHLDRIARGLAGEDLGVGAFKVKEEVADEDDLAGVGGRRKRKRGNDRDMWRDAGMNPRVKKEINGRQRLMQVPEVRVAGEEAKGVDFEVGQEGDAAGSEWQDRETYERQQEVEEGEIGDRVPPGGEPVFGQDEEVQVVEQDPQDDMDIDHEEGDGHGALLDAAAKEAIDEIVEDKAKRPKTKAEKEDRKKRKKERAKEERRTKAKGLASKV